MAPPADGEFSASLSPNGLLRCQIAPQETRNGDRYWRLGIRSIDPEKGPPVWVSEVEWLLEVLADIAATLDIETFEPAVNEYPLAFRATGMHALCVLLHQGSDASDLWIERWSASHSNSKNTTQFSTYWYCNKPFRSYSRLKVPLKRGWSDALATFANSWRESLEQTIASDWAKLGASNSALSSVLPETRRLIVTIPSQVGARRVPYHPFCLDPRDAVLLEQPFRRLLLESCNLPRTSHQVAQLIQAVDEAAVRNELLWTSRYDDETLKEAAFFSATRVDGHDHLAATIRLPSFLADPLLTSLAPFEALGSEPGPLGISPQRREGIPIAELRSRKMIQVDTIPTALGSYPLPSPAEIKSSRAAAKPPSRLAQESWRIFQLLDIESRCQANLVRSNAGSRLLGWQRLAMLRWDCDHLLAKEADNAPVQLLLKQASDRHGAIVAGQQRHSTVLRSKELPKPNA